MTDYYVVLKRAVGGLEHEASDVRRSIYDKARSALLGQLKAITPPLTTAEISKQRLELEEAIRRVEREAAMTAAGPSPARVRAAAAAADAMAAEAMRLATEEEAEVEAEAANPAPPPAPPRPRATPVPPDFRAPEPRSSDQRGMAPRNADASLDAGQNRNAARVSPPRQPAAPAWTPEEEPIAEVPRRVSQAPRQEPRFGDEVEAMEEPVDVAPIEADERSEWPDDSDSETRLAPVDEPPRRERREKRPRKEQPAYVERAKPSRGPAIIIILIIAVLILGGIAALVWSQRAKVNDVVGDLISSDKGSAPTAQTEPAPDAASSKNADRLGGAPAEEAPKSVRTVTAEPPAEGTEPDPLAGVVQPGSNAPSETAPAPQSDASASPATPAPAEQTDNAATPGDDLVAQKAILYEQPLGGSANVTALQANVTWKFEPDSSNGPQIVANVDVPDRQMKVTVNIRKNNDTALPASHLVEVIIDTPADFPGGGVKAVPAFVMKPTEEARGVPLDGAAAKVADGFFWIAFANDSAPMAQNIALMKERNWIDIPLVYNNDQRAILTLEKGTPGQRVFDKALAAWGN
ncbi:hypothetical protein SAMN02745157_4761 [Kaistia soli DSM 19436]|uniref:CheA signal transduction histidine kinase n=1 Tax=Kaistia soli DSM 19436 TaxID=1122133 RepID=A0A1M5MDI6_9HYPH|nr:hypothetical protein [Kaistia soli]SHG75464.1 hypothetical protein SAMN02745157_4761 [Kaistia soli DSM 19436]